MQHVVKTPLILRGRKKNHQKNFLSTRSWHGKTAVAFIHYIRYIKGLIFKKLLAEDPVFQPNFKSQGFLISKFWFQTKAEFFHQKKGRRRVEILLHYCCQNSKAVRKTVKFHPGDQKNEERSPIQETSYNAAHRRQQEIDIAPIQALTYKEKGWRLKSIR